MALLEKLRARLGRRDDMLNHRALSWLGTRLHDPKLWHFGRRSVAGGCGLGLLIAFFPLPIHMVVAPPIAVALRVNLPLALAVTWMSNPVTLVPLLYLDYEIGSWILGTPAVAAGFNADFNFAALTEAASRLWLPLCLGSIVCGVTAASGVYFAVQGLWRWRIRQRLRRRRERRGVSKALAPRPRLQ
ncbi:MAG: DUF2062 domain-containing protein [Gammaproteobacteria bacterium]|nr:DUF2062 domain-containing protein [Gammaproteobacteria bacterium]